MSMQSHIEFNVSLNGIHFFATAPRSCSAYDLTQAANLAKVLAAKFPESEGYKISCTRWEGLGQGLNIESLLTNKEGK